MSNNKQFWRNSFIDENSTIRDAIVNLDLFGNKIVLVVNNVGEFLGTVSDGDIRRGILRGLTPKDRLHHVINFQPTVVSPLISDEAVLKLMNAQKLQQIPVLDEKRNVVGLHLWDKISGGSEKSNLIVIMAGGKGKRLSPYTEDCPKPLLKVAGKPMLEHIISSAREEGFRNFVIATHYLGHMIEEYFGNGSALGVDIEYLREPRPMGTAGALSMLSPPTESVIVTNGDVLTDIRYAGLLDFHLVQSADATMAVGIHEWEHPFGVVNTSDGEIVGFEEKPISVTHINAGVYALKPSSLDKLCKGEICDMPDLFQRLREHSLRTVAYPLYESWLDVGRPNDLEKARKQGNKFVQSSK